MDIRATFLDEGSRRRALAELASTSVADPLDVLVVGGGVTGAGAALDAATRGLRVGLVERADYASGASGASSRLAHGGLRYLEHGQVGLVAEALRERRLLITHIAPHLTRRVDFLLPCRTLPQTWYARTGVAAYAALARAARGSLDGPPDRIYRRAELARIAPDLDTSRFRSAISYRDGQIDDARHTIALVRTAQAFGAHVANYAAMSGPATVDPGGLVRCPVDADGDQFTVHARAVLLACGPWTNAMIGQDDTSAVRPSKGIHIVVPRERIDLRHAIISRTATSVLFILPWHDTWIIGTTDTGFYGDPSEVHAEEAEVDYLIGAANAVVRAALTRQDVVATFAGIRPLASATGDTARASREHVVRRVRPGVFTLTGGKFTTYRVMAKDGIDAVCRHLGRDRLPSRTEDIPVVGAPGSGFTAAPGSTASPATASASAVTDGRDASLAAHLVRRYDAEGPLLAAQDWGVDAADPVDPSGAHLRADVEHAFRHEGARTVDDVLTRRLRLTTTNAAHALAARPVVEQIAARLAPNGFDGASAGHE